MGGAHSAEGARSKRGSYSEKYFSLREKIYVRQFSRTTAFRITMLFRASVTNRCAALRLGLTITQPIGYSFKHGQEAHSQGYGRTWQANVESQGRCCPREWEEGRQTAKG